MKDVLLTPPDLPWTKSAQYPEGIVSQFLHGYLVCAVWASLDDDGNSLDENYSSSDFDDASVHEAENDCREFMDEASDDLEVYFNATPGASVNTAGHDFWLSRNGHGAGFFDKDNVPEDVRNRLQEKARGFGEVNVFVSQEDEGFLYFEGGGHPHTEEAPVEGNPFRPMIGSKKTAQTPEQDNYLSDLGNLRSGNWAHVTENMWWRNGKVVGKIMSIGDGESYVWRIHLRGNASGLVKGTAPTLEKAMAATDKAAEEYVATHPDIPDVPPRPPIFGKKAAAGVKLPYNLKGIQYAHIPTGAIYEITEWGEFGSDTEDKWLVKHVEGSPEMVRGEEWEPSWVKDEGTRNSLRSLIDNPGERPEYMIKRIPGILDVPVPTQTTRAPVAQAVPPPVPLPEEPPAGAPEAPQEAPPKEDPPEGSTESRKVWLIGEAIREAPMEAGVDLMLDEKERHGKGEKGYELSGGKITLIYELPMDLRDGFEHNREIQDSIEDAVQWGWIKVIQPDAYKTAWKTLKEYASDPKDVGKEFKFLFKDPKVREKISGNSWLILVEVPVVPTPLPVGIRDEDETDEGEKDEKPSKKEDGA